MVSPTYLKNPRLYDFMNLKHSKLFQDIYNGRKFYKLFSQVKTILCLTMALYQNLQTNLIYKYKCKILKRTLSAMIY